MISPAHAPAGDSGKPRVAAFGLFYAGKSSLLNMLADSLRTELFATCELGSAFVRQTASTGFCVLSNTPDLDGPEAPQAAADALAHADIALLVHAPGEWQPEELRWLQAARQRFGAQVNQRLVIVLTHRDKSQNGSAEAEAQALMAGLKQLHAQLQPACLSVSSSFYRKGRLDNRDDLVLASNLPALRQYLQRLCAQLPQRLAGNTQPAPVAPG